MQTLASFPKTDNECTMLNWCEALIEFDNGQSLHISHPKEADLDGSFLCFCHDSQERLRVSGWLMSSYEHIGGPMPDSY